MMLCTIVWKDIYVLVYLKFKYKYIYINIILKVMEKALREGACRLKIKFQTS